MVRQRKTLILSEYCGDSKPITTSHIFDEVMEGGTNVLIPW